MRLVNKGRRSGVQKSCAVDLIRSENPRGRGGDEIYEAARASSYAHYENFATRWLRRNRTKCTSPQFCSP